MEVEGPLITSWRLVDGKAYYFVHNLSDKAVRGARMQLHGTPRDGEAKARGEGRSVSYQGREMVDDFGAYETHIYEIGDVGGKASLSAVFSRNRIRD
jgi:hypothetical protein